MKAIFFSLFIFGSAVIFCQQYHFNQHEVSTDLLRMNPTKLYRYKNELLFICTREGLIAFDGKKHDILLRGDGGIEEPTTFFHDGHQIWIGYSDGGIFILKNFKLTPWLMPEGWPKTKITGIGKDNLGQMWFATYGEGVFVFSNNKWLNFDTSDGLAGIDIYNLVSDKTGKIYVATDNGLQWCMYKQGKKKVKKLTLQANPISNEIITTMKIDDYHNKLYIGTFQKGLWVYDIKTENIEIGRAHV